MSSLVTRARSFILPFLGYSGVLALFLATGTSGAAPSASGTSTNPVAPPAAAPATAPHESLPAGSVLPGESIYQLKLELEDQQGRKSGVDVFKGQPVIISMFYATCPHACPMLIADLKNLEAKLPAAVKAQTRVLLVTFTPDVDDPAKFRSLAELHGLDLERWKLARAPDVQVRELAAVLGIKYRQLEDGSVNHTSLLTLLDQQGRVVTRLEGLRQPPEAFIQSLTDLMKVPVPSPAR